MLNKLPPRVMEGILALLNTVDYLELGGVSPRMWKIVTETPKTYGSIRVFDGVPDSEGMLVLGFSAWETPNNMCLHGLAPSRLPKWIEKDDGRTVLVAGFFARDKYSSVTRTAFLRLLLANSSIRQLRNAPLAFGNPFWFSLNMKVTRISNPTAVSSVSRLREFIGHLQPKEFIYDVFDRHLPDDGVGCARLLRSSTICSLDMLQITFDRDRFRYLDGLRVKDLTVRLNMISSTIPALPTKATVSFLLQTVLRWLHGDTEIDKIQLPAGVDSNFEAFFKPLMAILTPKLGWIDRTYEGMELILRASDGQALITYLDKRDGALLLIKCDYNFRRGRCLGSYERNRQTLNRIRDLLRKWPICDERSPGLISHIKKKLAAECIKFNEFNKGATKRDLMTDAIWRPKTKRRSPWGCYENATLRDDTFPLELAVRHTYQFTKAFEERGVLPDADEFKPAKDTDIATWNERYREMIV